MEKKTLKVEQETWKRLTELKLKGNFSTIDATIQFLLNNTRRLKELLK